MINRESIEAIKSKANVLEVVQHFMKLKKESGQYVGLCPFHAEKTPSFKVSPAKGIYKCFGCGKSGDAIAFVMEKESKSYIEAIRWLASFYKVHVEEESISKKVFAKPAPRLEKLRKELIIHFEEKRKISNNTLLRFNITEAKEWMHKAAKEVNVICFNYYRDGELINIKFRASGKDFKMAKDAEQIFYNIDAIKNENTCVIVEGEVDCLTMYECGIYNVVSVPNGSGAGVKGTAELKLEFLDNCWEAFIDKTSIILMVDNDIPGIALRDELARRLGIERCKKVAYPAGCKDANDVLVKYGKTAVLQCFADAEEFPIEGILTANDVVDDIINFYENGYPNGYDIPIPGLKGKLQLMLGQFTTVTGIPGHGKSEFIDWVMVEMSRAHEWIWAVISFENQPVSLHITKLIQKYYGKSFGFRYNMESRIPKGNLGPCIKFVDDYFQFINVNEVDASLDGILKKAKELVLRKGIKALLIDPWNRIEHKSSKNEDKLEYLNRSLASISRFSKLYGVHVILIAHPTKMQKDKSGKYEVPTMYSVSGGADFYNMTDNGISVYRDHATGIVDIYRQKIRYDWLGETGFTSYNYSKETRQYSLIEQSTGSFPYPVYEPMTNSDINDDQPF